MARYKFNMLGEVVDTQISKILNQTLDNPYWVEYLAWVDAGNVTDPFDVTELDRIKVNAINDLWSQADELIVRGGTGLPGPAANNIPLHVAEKRAKVQSMQHAARVTKLSRGQVLNPAETDKVDAFELYLGWADVVREAADAAETAINAAGSLEEINAVVPAWPASL